MRVIFDLSGTLVQGPDDFIKSVSKNLLISENEFRKFLKGTMEEKLKQLFRGRVSESEFWYNMSVLIKLCFPEVHDGDYETNSKLLRGVFYQAAKKTIPGTLDTYKRIMYYPMHIGSGGRVGRGTPELCIVADYTNDMVPLLREWHPDIFEIAKAELWSSMMGQVIDDPCFFPLLLNGLRGEPDEFLFISADQRAIDAAMQSKIPCIRFRNAEQLERRMVNKGFLFFPKEQ